MATGFGGIGGVIGSIGTAFSDFGTASAKEAEAQGDFTSAADYLKAEDIAKQGEGIVKEGTAIQTAQLQRKILQTNATGQAQVANNNLEGGSAGDILRMGMQQGALATAVVKQQGAINQNAYQQQAEAFQGESDAAVAAGNANLKAAEAANTGGVFSLIGGAVGVLGMFM